MGVATRNSPLWRIRELSRCRLGGHLSPLGRLALRSIQQSVSHCVSLRSRRRLPPPARSTQVFNLFGVISTTSPSSTTDQDGDLRPQGGDSRRPRMVGPLWCSSGRTDFRQLGGSTSEADPRRRNPQHEEAHLTEVREVPSTWRTDSELGKALRARQGGQQGRWCSLCWFCKNQHNKR